VQIHQYQVTFSWLVLSGTLLITGCFTSLGFWQLNRAEEKRLIHSDIVQSINRKAIQLFSPITDNWENLRYRPVKARGYFGNSFIIYIDNRVHEGKAGYHVISPFYLETSKKNGMGETIILVNRGWMPVGNDRSLLPEVITPEGIITLDGRLSSPRSKPTLIGGDELPDTYSDQVWTYLDINYVEEKYQLQLEPYIILQESDSADGLIRKLPEYQSNVTMHIGYAIQWFAFALFVVLVFIKNGITIEKS